METGRKKTIYKDMKKIKSYLIGALVALPIISCSAAGLIGIVYSGYTEPVAVTSNTLGTKVGTAKCNAVLGIAAYGDGGIEKAAKSAGITKISHVDAKNFNVLGIYQSVTYIVYGE